MGVNLGELIPRKEIELIDLSGKKIAIDAYNQIYQFLSIIRDKTTGEPLRDSKGRPTSHLSGLFYRTAKIIAAGIKPVFVFDGEPPLFKRKTIEEREKRKEEAEEKLKEALERGEAAITYAQATARVTKEIVEESKKLLRLMGIPVVQAKSEGEAQCAFMARKGDVFASASQDYDSLLFGSPKLVRNLSLTGKRKLPRKEVYVEVKPELIELDNVLKTLKITREQLIIMGILIGTDYNPGGVKGIGPKKALEIARRIKNPESIKKIVKWEFDVEPEEIFDFFMNPPVTEEYEIKWERPKKEELIKFMVEEHDFSYERVKKTLDSLEKVFVSGRQSSLSAWFNK